MIPVAGFASRLPTSQLRNRIRATNVQGSQESPGAYGNENWEFHTHGLMRTRHASINDLPIPLGSVVPLGRRRTTGAA